MKENTADRHSHASAGECCHNHHHHSHEHNHHHHSHEHGHGHDHHHEHGDDWHGRLARIVLAAVLLAAAWLVERYAGLPLWAVLLVYLVPYLTVGYETLGEAVEGIAHGDAFNEDLLMSVATIGALAIGFLPGAEPEFAEAVFVMLFFQVGELFEGYAEGQSRRSISHLMELRPDVANVERADGTTAAVDPAEVAVGDVIVVRPGEKVPIDGTVIEGTSTLNTAALTGESLPREVGEGEDVMSGCINLSGVLRLRTTHLFAESTVSKIIALVQSADENKSRSESFITRFARVYTPVVVLSALVLALVPPMLSGSFVASFPTWLHRALIFLVVSCPCALVISVPLTFFGGLGGASRRGILVKGSSFMDALAKLDTVVFDKTGTLTCGEFVVTSVHPEHESEEQLLHLAAHVEHYSTHPIAEALRAAFPDEATDGCRITDIEEIPGHGISANVEGSTVCVGNSKMMDRIGAKWHDCHIVGTIIHVAVNGEYAGHIVIADREKPDSATAIADLKRVGVGCVAMLTGDSHEVAADVARRLGVDRYFAELLPAGKVEHLEQLIGEKPTGSTVAFVGDGINDAPVLKRADVGIAMGALGSDAAIDAADVVLMDDNPKRIATAISIARRTIAIARQNVWFAIGVKVLVLVLAVLGISTMWMAVFADVGVTVLAVLNAMRALGTKAQ